MTALPNAPALVASIRSAGLALGFARVGFARIDGPLAHEDAFFSWLDAGMAGTMAYLERSRNQRAHPVRLLPSAQTAITVAAKYADGTADPPRASGATGRIARYARGPDYHQVLHRRLAALAEEVQRIIGAPVEHRAVVDTAPLLDRELATAGGIGFIGKNTMLITPGVGSYTVLGALLVALELPADDPVTARCGTCTLCLEACPTEAIVAEQTIDARRCIAYQTIEHRGEVDPTLLPAHADWVFGCDICQEVCPYNHPASATAPVDHELGPDDRAGVVDLIELIALRSGAYRRLVRHRALRRAPRVSYVRNALIAAASVHGDHPRLDAAIATATDVEDGAVRTAARWAAERRREQQRQTIAAEPRKAPVI